MTTKFIAWCFYATLSSAGIFLITFFPYDKQGGSLWMEGNFSYVGVVTLANVKVLTDTTSHTFISFFWAVISVVVFFLVYYILNLFPDIVLYGSFGELITSREFYMGMLFMLIALILIEIGINYVNHLI